MDAVINIFFNHQMRFTKSIIELLEGVESVGIFFLYVLGFLALASIGILIFFWWALKSRLL